MRMVEVSFSQTWKPTDEELLAVKAAQVWGDEIKKDTEGTLRWWCKYLVDLDRMPAVPYELVRTVLCTAPLGLDLETANRPLQYNMKVNVAVPGIGLLLIDEVRVMADTCTDSLNEELGKGWRILAICPQPDQRRPDYVLGRANTKDV